MSTIAITNSVDKKIYSSVSVDDISESKKIVNYLCKNGNRKIAVLASYSTDKSISNLRLEGYRRALIDNNIEFNDKLIRYTCGDCNSYSMQNGYNMTKELLESDEEFTDIYAISDSMAIGSCKAILDSGNKIPEDYSVVGFDGLDLTYYYNPSITTIRQPVEEMAKETIRILFDLINKKSKHHHKVFEGELLIRQSTCKIDN